MATRRPAAAGAGAGDALRVQPDHGASRPRRSGPRATAGACAGTRHVRYPAAHRPRPRRDDVVQRRAPAPGARPRDACDHRPDAARRAGCRRLPRDRGRRVRGPSRTPADGRRRAAAPRAGVPAGGTIPGTACRGTRTRLAVRAPHRALRHTRRAHPRGARADRAAHARGAPAGRRPAPARAADRGACVRPGRPAGRVARSYVRGDRTRYYVERVVVRSGSGSGETAPGAVDARIGIRAQQTQRQT